jgi:hypothetical protein
LRLNLRGRSPSFSAKERRIVWVFQGEFGDATDWCKELKALPILNLPVTSSGLFHKVFNKPVEK